MSPVLTALGLAALLQIVQIALYAVLGNRELGVSYALSPRDETRSLSGTAARAQRAMNNHFESLLLFAIAVCLCQFSQSNTHLTAGAAWTYIIARTLYIPAYLFGLSPWRTILWTLGLGAICVILGASLI